MAATVTLATTTLTRAVSPSDSDVQLASLTGVVPGLRLYMDRELMTVLSLGIGTLVNVLRGKDGTITCGHSGGSTVTIGRGDQFYDFDPVGLPPNEVLVSPWINVRNGKWWTAEGDEVGPGLSARYWAETTATRSIGALGARLTTNAATTTTLPL